jgi:hypothetical protein
VPSALVAVGAASAADVPVAGRQLVISDKWTLAGRAKIVYVGLDGGITKGSGVDVGAFGA